LIYILRLILMVFLLRNSLSNKQLLLIVLLINSFKNNLNNNSILMIFNLNFLLKWRKRDRERLRLWMRKNFKILNNNINSNNSKVLWKIPDRFKQDNKRKI